MNRRVIGVVAALVGAAPVVVLAPSATGQQQPSTVASVVAAAHASGLQGWDLVDEAVRLVRECSSFESRWHLWETPGQSLARGRGRSSQYNMVLARVLDDLGFRVRLVHAARVRRRVDPWWCSGHVWVEVSVGNQAKDACAGSATLPSQHVDFVPVTEVRPFHTWTYVDTAIALAPFVASAVWSHIVRRTALPLWLYRPL